MPIRRKCSICNQIGHDKRACARGRNGKPFDPWNDLEWAQHLEAQQIVNENPDGMTLEQVGEKLGVTRERVRQIEAIAMEKLRTGLAMEDTIDMGDSTIAIRICDECDSYFPREGGRSRLCQACQIPTPKKPKKRRRKRSNVPKPRVRVKPKNRPEFTLTIGFDFRGM